MATKLDVYRDIVRTRQGDRLAPHACIGDFHGGLYECDFVSPWSKSACNLDAAVMVVAQDWAGADYLAGPPRPFLAELGYDPALATNRNLHRLLGAHFDLGFGDVFATNLFPFVKLGGMSATIPRADLVLCARKYLLSQIEVVRPKLVICLGLACGNALRLGYGLPSAATIGEAIDNPISIAGTRAIGLAHTGRLGTNARGPAQVERDWARAATLLTP